MGPVEQQAPGSTRLSSRDNCVAPIAMHRGAPTSNDEDRRLFFGSVRHHGEVVPERDGPGAFEIEKRCQWERCDVSERSQPGRWTERCRVRSPPTDRSMDVCRPGYTSRLGQPPVEKVLGEQAALVPGDHGGDTGLPGKRSRRSSVGETDTGADASARAMRSSATASAD